MEYILVKENIEVIGGLFNTLEKEIDNSTVTSRDFDYAYCQLGRLVCQFIEYIIREEKDFDKGYDIDKALIIGNYVHMYKMLLVIDKHIYTNNIEYEVAMDFSRKIIEISETSRYLIKHFNDGAIEAYKQKFIKAENAFKDKVNDDIKNENNETPMQSRILNSINKTLEILKVDNCEKVKKFPIIETIFKDLKDDWLYDICYRTLSHSIHADANHIIKNDIIKNGDLFKINFERKNADIRLYNPTLIFILKALFALINCYDFNFDKSIMINELKTLYDYVIKLEYMHENFISK